MRLISSASQFLVALLLALTLPACPLLAADLDDIHQLRDTGFPGLAVRTLDRFQPDVGADPDGWLRWERERFKLYERSGQLDQLIERIGRYRKELPDRHARTLMFHGVSAHLTLEDGAGARSLLSDLLLGQRGELDPNQEAFARRLLVTSYLYENQPREAMVALRHLQEEFGDRLAVGPGLDEWQQQQAQVYLQNGDLQKAEAIISRDGQKGVYSPLRLLVHLRSGRFEPRQAALLAQEQLARGAEPAGAYQAVIAEASLAIGDHLGRVQALEQAMTRTLGAARGIYRADALNLWQAYRALRPGLARMLNVNERAAARQWVARAESLARDAARRPGRNGSDLVRYIYAMLAASENGGLGNLAHSRLATVMLQQPRGFSLLKAIYMNRELFPGPADIPAGVRHLLIGEAIRQADTPLASQLMRGLRQAPPGVARLDWQLRQARVHVMAGNPQQGMQVILGLLKNVHRYEGEQVDRLVQVLFDLQAIGEHRAVIPLLETIYTRTGDGQRRRELLYWIADSMKELKEYDEAARYYLKSATLIERKAMDMWARSARFQAAEMLTQAGLPADARKIYRELLAVTREPGQRKQLERNIQQLAYRH